MTWSAKGLKIAWADWPRLAVGLGLLFLVLAQVHSQEDAVEPDESVIHYHDSADLADPVALLQKKIDAGKVMLEYEPKHGYLVSVLKELGVPASSQSLVYSKTSQLIPLIGPKTPRAIYFNDEAYVAWVQGADHLEFAMTDPQKGAVFYSLDQKPGAHPTFVRRFDCVRCHLGPKTVGVPGFLVRSNMTAPDGRALSQVTDFVSGHTSPMSERWGGWYVTGTHKNDVHMGNIFLEDYRHPEKFDKNKGANITDLRPMFDTTKYLTPHSDIVALLVLDHAVRMHDLIAHATYETKLALHDLELAAKSDGKLFDWSKQRIATAGNALIANMLFRDEAPLKGLVRGTSGFTEEFEKDGPWDSRRRSLRQFDLRKRLFRYPCSYLIYSEAFDAMPGEMKEYVWGRLGEILRGQDRSALYVNMAERDRRAVREILLDTKPEFRAWWDAHYRNKH